MGNTISRCSCESLEDRDSHASSSSTEDRHTLVAIENDVSSEGEDSISSEENRGITTIDEDGIPLRHVENSMNTEMGLDFCGHSASTYIVKGRI